MQFDLTWTSQSVKLRFRDLVLLFYVMLIVWYQTPKPLAGYSKVGGRICYVGNCFFTATCIYVRTFHG